MFLPPSWGAPGFRVVSQHGGVPLRSLIASRRRPPPFLPPLSPPRRLTSAPAVGGPALPPPPLPPFPLCRVVCWVGPSSCFVPLLFLPASRPGARLLFCFAFAPCVCCLRSPCVVACAFLLWLRFCSSSFLACCLCLRLSVVSHRRAAVLLRCWFASWTRSQRLIV